MKGLSIAFLCLSQLVVAFDGNAQEAEPSYPKELSQWKEMTPPPASEAAERDKWFRNACGSNLEWRVYALAGGEPCAEPVTIATAPTKSPAFVPKVGRFTHATAHLEVDEGWLVGFNQGEFGAAIYWFSKNGSKNYKISDHQFVAFARNADGIFAVEGLAHLDTDEGTVIRLVRSGVGNRWKAISVASLPSAPYAVSVRKDGTLVIKLTNGIAEVNRTTALKQVLTSDVWNGWYPTSSILSADENLLFIGMRQFVVELNLKSHAIRYLLPDAKLLN